MASTASAVRRRSRSAAVVRWWAGLRFWDFLPLFGSTTTPCPRKVATESARIHHRGGAAKNTSKCWYGFLPLARPTLRNREGAHRVSHSIYQKEIIAQRGPFDRLYQSLAGSCFRHVSLNADLPGFFNEMPVRVLR